MRDSKAEQWEGRRLIERAYRNGCEVITLFLMAGRGRWKLGLTGSWLGNTLNNPNTQEPEGEALRIKSHPGLCVRPLQYLKEAVTQSGPNVN